jgi:hypothetical protein
VGELDGLLRQVSALVPMRFLLTQCFSGAFTRLAREGTNRCGFMAEAEDREAEGCSASLDLGDYRDYSTYFFAALAGRNRDGTPLPHDPDRDGGGVSPREAHLYTLRAGRSADLPRATSEDFLERWLPWYLRWVHWIDVTPPDDEYARIARDLAAELGLESGADLPQRLRERRRMLETERDRLLAEQDALENAIAGRREPIRQELLRRWPEAGNGFTAAYRDFLLRDLDQAQDFILAHPDYAGLLAGQQAYWVLEGGLLENDRAVSQIDKIERLAWLGRLRGAFAHFASPAARRTYESLLACEQAPL